MHTRFSCLIIWCACLSAQPGPTPVVRNARELSLSQTVDAVGATTIRLRNEYSAAATAWIVECHGETDPGREWGSEWHWIDQDLSVEGNPLGPGKETEFQFRRSAASARRCDNLQVIGSVFTDGTVSGDLSWIDAIVEERRRVYQDIAKGTEMLNKAITEGSNAVGVTKQLMEWRKAELPGSRAPNAAGYGESSGAFRQTSRPGGPLAPKATPPARPFARAAVPIATIWLIQERGKSLADSVKILSDWRERLGQIRPVTEAAGSTSPLDTRRGLQARAPTPDLVGKLAPDFTLRDVDGHEVTLKDLRGKAVLLSFWATWCAPCRNEMPQLEALYEAFKDKGLVVLGINSTESGGTARKHFAGEGYTFQSLLDPVGEANNKYGAGGIPRTILIDKDGIVRYFHLGYGPQMDFRSEVLKLGLE